MQADGVELFPLLLKTELEPEECLRRIGERADADAFFDFGLSPAVLYTITRDGFG